LGLVDELQGMRICMDTAPIIYFIEKNPKYLRILKPVFLEIDTGGIEARTSTLTLLEVLVHPFRTKNDILAERYRDILLYSEGLTTFEIFHEVSEMSSKLRRRFNKSAGSGSWAGNFGLLPGEANKISVERQGDGLEGVGFL